jgi:hypothetical protein
MECRFELWSVAWRSWKESCVEACLVAGQAVEVTLLVEGKVVVCQGGRGRFWFDGAWKGLVLRGGHVPLSSGNAL